MAKKEKEKEERNALGQAEQEQLDKFTKAALKKWRNYHDDADYMKMSVKKIIEHCFINGYLFGLVEGNRKQTLKEMVENTDQNLIIVMTQK